MRRTGWIFFLAIGCGAAGHGSDGGAGSDAAADALPPYDLLIPDDAGPPPDLATTPDLVLVHGACLSPADCDNGQLCVAPGVSLCGHCVQPPLPCASDGDCKMMGASYICDTGPCLCNGALTCQAGCTIDAECGSWQFCAPDHHCTGLPCLKDGDCPKDFACAKDQHCARKACASDGDCMDYCVDGQCYNTPGKCTVPPP